MRFAKSKTIEEALKMPAILDQIRSMLRPFLLRRWRVSRDCAVRDAVDAGMTQHERKIFLAGFNSGWVSGLKDASVNLQDLRDQEDPTVDVSVH